MNYSFQIEINAPAHVVFENITQHEKNIQWMPTIKKFEFVGDVNHANPIGAKFKQVVASSRGDQYFEGEILDFKKDEKISTSLHNFKATVKTTYKLSPKGAGTLLEYEMDMRIHIFIARFFASMMTASIKKNAHAQIEQLKTFSEK